MKKRLISLALSIGMLFTMAPVAFAVQITTPTGLQWVSQAGTIDQIFTDSDDGPASLSVYPGDILWNRATDGTNSYFIELLKDGQVIDSSRHNFSALDISDQLSLGIFCEEPRESGNYTFTVKALGDGQDLEDSGVATSPEWVYTAPSAQLATPTNLHWEGTTAYWDAVPNAGSYTIQWYYSPTVDGVFQPAGYTSQWIFTSIDLESWVVQENGSGYYTFAIRALSNDVNTYRTGELSAQSIAYHTETGTTVDPDIPEQPSVPDEPPKTVEDTLENILNAGSANTPEAIREEIKDQVNYDDLRIAMSADQNNADVNSKIQELEKKTNVTVSAQVDNEIGLNDSEVSMIGAALNAGQGSTSVTLQISKPSQDMVVPGTYINAIQFDFKLDGVESTEKLAVPIKISMPVPAGIDPQNLRILHYSADGNVDEVLNPYVFQQNEKWYASFVVTHFSTFVFAEEDNSVDDTTEQQPSGGGSSSSGSSNYSLNVSSASHGTIDVSHTKAARGATITLTVTPDTGYELDTLTVTDADGDAVSLTQQGNNKYTFTMPASRITISASFAPIQEPEPEPEPEPSSLPFTDISASDWYADAVQFVYDNGLMTGTSDTAFSPNETTTRGMIVTILYRLEGEPAAAASSFQDVPAGQYYTDAVAWASANNIVSGYGDGLFGPNDTITREQMAAILYRYAQYKAYDVTASNNLSGFADASSISSYAASAMQWANGNGLITGNTATTINPLGSATRAEVATILMRFFEQFV